MRLAWCLADRAYGFLASPEPRKQMSSATGTIRTPLPTCVWRAIRDFGIALVENFSVRLG